jgi:hypothetical protein
MPTGIPWLDEIVENSGLPKMADFEAARLIYNHVACDNVSPPTFRRTSTTSWLDEPVAILFPMWSLSQSSVLSKRLGANRRHAAASSPPQPQHSPTFSAKSARLACALGSANLQCFDDLAGNLLAEP